MKDYFFKLAIQLMKALLGPEILVGFSLLFVYGFFRENLLMLWWPTVVLLAAFLLAILFGLVAWTAERVHEPDTLKKAPGVWLISLVNFLYSEQEVEKTFKPIVSDWRKEYFKALATQCLWRSRWINVKYRYRFAQAMGLCKAWQLVDKVMGVVSSVSSK